MLRQSAACERAPLATVFGGEQFCGAARPSGHWTPRPVARCVCELARPSNPGPIVQPRWVSLSCHHWWVSVLGAIPPMRLGHDTSSMPPCDWACVHGNMAPYNLRMQRFWLVNLTCSHAPNAAQLACMHVVHAAMHRSLCNLPECLHVYSMHPMHTPCIPHAYPMQV